MLLPRFIRSVLSLGTLAASLAAAEPTATEVREALRQAAHTHLANPSGVDICHWVIAPFYDGLLRAGFTTGDAALVTATLQFGQQAGWMPGYRTYHADDQAVGHAWLDLYLLDQSKKERLGPIQAHADYVIAHPITEALAHGNPPQTPGVEFTDRWTWCDALYMAPPTLARLHAATGDKKYLDFLDREFRYTYDHLYDKEAGFFYRDGRFVGQKTKAGHRTFWSRGNGWVYGGLALLLEQLPAGHPTRPFYQKLYLEMTAAVLRTQQASGLWNPNLDDPAEIPMGEASGSGFFVFGLAWGVNHGLLDRAAHWPAIARGWQALLGCRRPDGMVGYVQPIGAAPDQFGPASIQDYGTGAFLLAGAEILRALGGATTESPAAILARAEAAQTAALRLPRAYARLVPERKGDLAWENDKVAFRVYGPALRPGPEDSGIDAWTKRVPYPVLDEWYKRDLTERRSYHADHGEGLDGYHVGDTRGCGGLGLWIDGKLVTSDTYTAGKIHWTKPGVAEFSAFYRYPVEVKGRPLYEHRTIRLRLGERLCEVESFFCSGPSRGPKPLPDFDPEIAIGLVTQGADAKLMLDATPRGIAVYEPFAGGSLGTGVIVGGDAPVRTATLPAADAKGLNRHALVITRLGADKVLRYRTGFAWSKDGEITSESAWLAYLKNQR
jgi:unsaturated rhamnogalacturonyl hydrolase